MFFTGADQWSFAIVYFMIDIHSETVYCSVRLHQTPVLQVWYKSCAFEFIYLDKSFLYE